MNRRARWAVVALAAVAAGGSVLWAPPLLRRLDWFRARQVEVTGARMLAPHEVLQVSGVRPGMNVWMDPAPWEAALRRHPAVASARVVRRLPHTLRVEVTEREPVALVQDGVLRPATADGRIIPVDPGRSSLDLPILLTGRGALRNGAATGAARTGLHELGRLATLDPVLLARVSEVAVDGGTLRLTLGEPAMQVLLPAGADTARLLRLRVALADAARRMAADSARTARVDARWVDQIVVRLGS